MAPHLLPLPEGIFLTSPIGRGPAPPKLANWQGNGDGRNSVNMNPAVDPFATADSKVWTGDDDAKLRDLVAKFGTKDWTAVADGMHSGYRTKQNCERRWLIIGPRG